MTSPMGDSPQSHEGTEDCDKAPAIVRRLVSREDLKAELWTMERRIMQQQAMERYALEKRLREEFAKRMHDAFTQLAEFHEQHVRLDTIEPHQLVGKELIVDDRREKDDFDGEEPY